MVAISWAGKKFFLGPAAGLVSVQVLHRLKHYQMYRSKSMIGFKNFYSLSTMYLSGVSRLRRCIISDVVRGGSHTSKLAVRHLETRRATSPGLSSPARASLARVFTPCAR